MSLNFPDSPTDGQVYGDYIYDATDGVWNKNPQQLASRFITSTTAPANPNNGDGWLDSNTGKTYVYYYDGSSGQWIESGNPVIGYVDPYDQDSTSTGYFSLPKGTDAQRPINPSNGDIRFNTESGEPEWYSEANERWVLFRNPPSIEVEYLVIAGGGGAGGFYGGGGGAGGYRSSVTGELSGGGSSSEASLVAISGLSYTVTVGAGGASGGSGPLSIGDSGENSVFASIVSVSGGGGGASDDTTPSNGLNGGSGGGGSDGGSGGIAEVGQGFAGESVGINLGGGGGGAGEAGGTDSLGYGGDGLTSSITGLSVTRGGGGAGWAAGDGIGGGEGGGGDTANGQGTENGVANTGGGGGGLRGGGTISGAGGSGIVILKYLAEYSITAGPGLTSPITSTVGDYKVTQFTGGTDTITFS